jgi:hypothetical protein
MDQAKEDTETRDLFTYVDTLVKLINSTFYDLGDDTNYIVIPWQDATPAASPASDPASAKSPLDEGETDKTQKPVQEVKKTTEETRRIFQKPNSSPPAQKTPYVAKRNSVTDDGINIYDAVLLPVGEWPYGDHTEIVDAETVREYFNDPLSVKEGYFHAEHPDNPAEVTRDDAIGKYQITGVDERGLIGTIYSKADLGDEFTLSNFYYSHDDEHGGQTVHRRIDFRNVVSTDQPRMPKARARRAKRPQ